MFHDGTPKQHNVSGYYQIERVSLARRRIAAVSERNHVFGEAILTLNTKYSMSLKRNGFPNAKYSQEVASWRISGSDIYFDKQDRNILALVNRLLESRSGTSHRKDGLFDPNASSLME